MMITVILLIAAIVMIIALYMLSLMPGRARLEEFVPFEKTMIAHRGFFDNDSDAPENSLPAFRNAVQRGFGVELDVQLTKDGKLVVFHDETLRRMCGANKVLTDLTYDELMDHKLMDSNEHIPLFEDVFNIFRDRVPAVIEIKAHGEYIKTAEKLMEYLDDYDGDFCVESFHPRLVRWLMKNRPNILRGQLSMRFKGKDSVPWIAKFVVTNLMTNFYARPDFIAYDFHQAGQFSYKLMRKLYRFENVAWTIRSFNDLEEAKKQFRVFIFDSFDPNISEDE